MVFQDLWMGWVLVGWESAMAHSVLGVEGWELALAA
jgi:hypothetical protein